jgi:hypothetical protein
VVFPSSANDSVEKDDLHLTAGDEL